MAVEGNSMLRPQLPDMESEDHHHHHHHQHHHFTTSPLHHFTTSHCTRTPLPASAWRVAALPRCSSPSSSSSWRGRASGPEPQDSADSDWFLRLENGAITCNNYPKLTFPMDLWIFNDVHHLESMICEAVLKSAHFRIRQIIEV